MHRSIILLQEACKKASQSKVANEIGISKASVNLLLKQKYPNPEKMYQKILDTYKKDDYYIGVDIGVSTGDVGIECIVELVKEIG